MIELAAPADPADNQRPPLEVADIVRAHGSASFRGRFL
jgi:hypothetical protein